MSGTTWRGSNIHGVSSPRAAPPAEPSRPATAQAEGDVRASRVYVLSRGPMLTLVRRTLSVVALVVLDVLGLALGIYFALVLRQFVLESGNIFWSADWRLPGRPWTWPWGGWSGG